MTSGSVMFGASDRETARCTDATHRLFVISQGSARTLFCEKCTGMARPEGSIMLVCDEVAEKLAR